MGGLDLKFSRRQIIRGGLTSSLFPALCEQAIAQCPPGVLTPANQSIVTVNQPFIARVYSQIAPNFYLNGSLIGRGTPSGSSTAFAISITPTALDFNASVTVQVPSESPVTVRLAIAEPNRFDTVMTRWSATNLRVSAGEVDPDGGVNAYKATALINGTASAHNLTSSVLQASVNRSSGFEIWAEYNPSFPIIMIYPRNVNTAQYCYVNLQNGDTNGNWAYAKIIETRGNWKRIWFYRAKGVATETVSIYACKVIGGAYCTTMGNEYIRFYKPRSADGLLPLTNFQQMQRKDNGFVNGKRQWLTRSPFNDNESYMSRDLPINVVVPDNYSPTNKYAVVYVLDVENVPGSNKLDGLKVLKDLNIHNYYNLILAQTFWQGGICPWYGTKSDGTIRGDIHLRDCLVGLVDEQFSTIPTREGRILLGFSTSGWGALSLLLRNPTVFGYAGCWDAPLNLTFGGSNYGQVAAYGTEAQYRLYNPKDILSTYLSSVAERKRIVLGGGVSFNKDTADFANLLTASGVPYTYLYRDLSKFGGRAANWNSYDNDYSGGSPQGWCSTFIPALMDLVAAR